MDFQLVFVLFIIIIITIFASTRNTWINIFLHVSFLTGFFYFYRKILLCGIIGSEVCLFYILIDIVRLIFQKLVAIYTPISTGVPFTSQVRKLGSQEG